MPSLFFSIFRLGWGLGVGGVVTVAVVLKLPFGGCIVVFIDSKTQ